MNDAGDRVLMPGLDCRSEGNLREPLVSGEVRKCLQCHKEGDFPDAENKLLRELDGVELPVEQFVQLIARLRKLPDIPSENDGPGKHVDHRMIELLEMLGPGRARYVMWAVYYRSEWSLTHEDCKELMRLHGERETVRGELIRVKQLECQGESQLLVAIQRNAEEERRYQLRLGVKVRDLRMRMALEASTAEKNAQMTIINDTGPHPRVVTSMEPHLPNRVSSPGETVAYFTTGAKTTESTDGVAEPKTAIVSMLRRVLTADDGLDEHMITAVERTGCHAILRCQTLILGTAVLGPPTVLEALMPDVLNWNFPSMRVRGLVKVANVLTLSSAKLKNIIIYAGIEDFLIMCRHELQGVQLSNLSQPARMERMRDVVLPWIREMQLQLGRVSLIRSRGAKVFLVLPARLGKGEELEAQWTCAQHLFFTQQHIGMTRVAGVEPKPTYRISTEDQRKDEFYIQMGLLPWENHSLPDSTCQAGFCARVTDTLGLIDYMEALITAVWENERLTGRPPKLLYNKVFAVSAKSLGDQLYYSALHAPKSKLEQEEVDQLFQDWAAGFKCVRDRDQQEVLYDDTPLGEADTELQKVYEEIRDLWQGEDALEKERLHSRGRRREAEFDDLIVTFTELCTVTKSPWGDCERRITEILKGIWALKPTVQQWGELMRMPISVVYTGTAWCGFTLDFFLGDPHVRRAWKVEEAVGYEQASDEFKEDIRKAWQRMTLSHLLILMALFRDGVLRQGLKHVASFNWSSSKIIIFLAFTGDADFGILIGRRERFREVKRQLRRTVLKKVLNRGGSPLGPVELSLFYKCHVELLPNMLGVTECRVLWGDGGTHLPMGIPEKLYQYYLRAAVSTRSLLECNSGLWTGKVRDTALGDKRIEIPYSLPVIDRGRIVRVNHRQMRFAMVVTNRDLQGEYRTPRTLRPDEPYRSNETMDTCPLTSPVQIDNGTDEEYGNHYPRGIMTERSRVKKERERRLEKTLMDSLRSEETGEVMIPPRPLEMRPNQQSRLHTVVPPLFRPNAEIIDVPGPKYRVGIKKREELQESNFREFRLSRKLQQVDLSGWDHDRFACVRAQERIGEEVNRCLRPVGKLPGFPGLENMTVVEQRNFVNELGPSMVCRGKIRYEDTTRRRFFWRTEEEREDVSYFVMYIRDSELKRLFMRGGEIISAKLMTKPLRWGSGVDIVRRDNALLSPYFGKIRDMCPMCGDMIGLAMLKSARPCGCDTNALAAQLKRRKVVKLEKMVNDTEKCSVGEFVTAIGLLASHETLLHLFSDKVVVVGMVSWKTYFPKETVRLLDVALQESVNRGGNDWNFDLPWREDQSSCMLVPVQIATVRWPGEARVENVADVPWCSVPSSLSSTGAYVAEKQAVEVVQVRESLDYLSCYPYGEVLDNSIRYSKTFEEKRRIVEEYRLEFTSEGTQCNDRMVCNRGIKRDCSCLLTKKQMSEYAGIFADDDAVIVVWSMDEFVHCFRHLEVRPRVVIPLWSLNVVRILWFLRGDIYEIPIDEWNEDIKLAIDESILQGMRAAPSLSYFAREVGLDTRYRDNETEAGRRARLMAGILTLALSLIHYRPALLIGRVDISRPLLKTMIEKLGGPFPLRNWWGEEHKLNSLEESLAIDRGNQPRVLSVYHDYLCNRLMHALELFTFSNSRRKQHKIRKLEGVKTQYRLLYEHILQFGRASEVERWFPFVGAVDVRNMAKFDSD